MRSFYLFSLGLALAEESCSDGTCAQDESTLLQMKGLRQHKHLQEPDADGVLNRGTQCWHGDQCDAQGGECPSGYCGDGGVCCRANWDALNDQEREECGATGYGIDGMHTCQPRLLNEGQQCWWADQCNAQGGRCQNYCGARGVCCRANWTPLNDQEREECGPNGHGNDGMHQCHLPPPPPLWGQTFIDRTKCNLNIGVQFVDSQHECQAVAEAAGHEFYSFRHNANNNGHKCFSSQNCDEENGLLLGDRTNEWKVYRRPFPNPAVIRNAYSGRRIFAQDWNNHEEGVGAGDGENLWADQRWVIEDAGDGNDAYVIRNWWSNRRLFAQDSGDWQNGVGAGNGDTVWADQKWFIVPTDDGKYIIRNFHSGRRLYAQLDESHEAGFGADDGDEVFADQKWFIHSTDDLPDGVALALMQPGGPGLGR